MMKSLAFRFSLSFLKSNEDSMHTAHTEPQHYYEDKFNFNSVTLILFFFFNVQ